MYHTHLTKLNLESQLHRIEKQTHESIFPGNNFLERTLGAALIPFLRGFTGLVIKIGKFGKSFTTLISNTKATPKTQRMQIKRQSLATKLCYTPWQLHWNKK